MDITKEELSTLIENAVKNAAKAHSCVFTAEEKQILKDLATGGKVFKKIVIYLVVGAILVGMGIQSIPSVVKALK